MYKKILVPVDLNRMDNAEKLCTAASEVANNKETVYRLVNVLPDYGMPLVGSYFPADAQAKHKADTKTELSKMENSISADVSSRVFVGNRAREILRAAEEWGADLIVIGSRKKASQEGTRVFGSCSSSVSNRARCSVLIVR